MKISKVNATWVHVPIPPERQHTSDFGRTVSFDSVIVKIVTDDGITGWGEAKAGVGSAAECAGLAAIVNQDFAPHLVGQPAGDISRLWDVLYNRLREGYAIARGHGLPQLGRRGLTICAIAAADTLRILRGERPQHLFNADVWPRFLERRRALGWPAEGATK